MNMWMFRLLITLLLISTQISAERLTDQHGKTIGTIRTQHNGTQVIQDNHGKQNCQYNPKTQRTTDKYGRYVGQGNQLLNTLPKKDKK